MPQPLRRLRPSPEAEDLSRRMLAKGWYTASPYLMQAALETIEDVEEEKRGRVLGT